MVKEVPVESIGSTRQRIADWLEPAVSTFYAGTVPLVCVSANSNLRTRAFLLAEESIAEWFIACLAVFGVLLIVVVAIFFSALSTSTCKTETSRFFPFPNRCGRLEKGEEFKEQTPVCWQRRRYIDYSSVD